MILFLHILRNFLSWLGILQTVLSLSINLIPLPKFNNMFFSFILRWYNYILSPSKPFHQHLLTFFQNHSLFLPTLSFKIKWDHSRMCHLMWFPTAVCDYWACKKGSSKLRSWVQSTHVLSETLNKIEWKSFSIILCWLHVKKIIS